MQLIFVCRGAFLKYRKTVILEYIKINGKCYQKKGILIIYCKKIIKVSWPKKQVVWPALLNKYNKKCGGIIIVWDYPLKVFMYQLVYECIVENACIIHVLENYPVKRQIPNLANPKFKLNSYPEPLGTHGARVKATCLPIIWHFIRKG